MLLAVPLALGFVISRVVAQPLWGYAEELNPQAFALTEGQKLEGAREMHAEELRLRMVRGGWVGGCAWGGGGRGGEGGWGRCTQRSGGCACREGVHAHPPAHSRPPALSCTGVCDWSGPPAYG